MYIEIRTFIYKPRSQDIAKDMAQKTLGTGGPHTDNASGPAWTSVIGVSRLTRSPSA